MNETKKIIKYLAIALAIFLIIVIISSVIFALKTVSGLLDGEPEEIPAELKYSSTFEIDNVRNIDIDLGGTSFKIEHGELALKTNNKHIKWDISGNTLKIREGSHHSIRTDNYELILYVPENAVFDRVEIDSGAGKLVISEINASVLDFEMGAGALEIASLNITERFKLNGGAGQVVILSGSVNDFDFDMGVGKADISLKLTGETDIDGGVGAIELELLGDKNDYTVKANKGIGSITVDGKSVSNDSAIGSGTSLIKIDGGVGSIKVKFE